MDESTVGKIYPADFLIILAFFAALPAIGAYFAKRMTNIKDFFSGGASLPWWLSGVSFYMASFSTMAFVTYSDMAYFNGMSAFYLYWCSVVGATLSAMFFAARWRRASTTSPLEYIRERYGDGMRQFLAWLGLPLRLIDNSIRLFAISKLVVIGLGLKIAEDWGIMQPGSEMYWMVIIAGIIIIAYTFLGGLWAIVVTDFVQFLVILSAVVVLLVMSIMKLGPFGGLGEFAPAFKYHVYIFFNFFNNTTYMRIDASYFLAWLVIISMSLSSSWALVQRYYSVKTDREARKVGYLDAVLVVFTPFLLFLPAMLARVYMPDLDPVADKNAVYGIISRLLLPAGMMGMLVAAMFSATMSTVGGDFNAMGSVATTDIYKLARPHGTPREYLMAARISTVVIGIITICVTSFIVWLFSHNRPLTLFELMTALFGIFLPPMAIPMLVGLWSRKMKSVAGVTGLLLGMGAGFTAFLINQKAMAWFGVDKKAIAAMLTASPESYPELSTTAFLVYNLGQTWLITTITVTATIIGVVLGNIFGHDDASRKQQVEGLFQRLERPEEAIIAERETKLKKVEFTPFPIIGIVFGLFSIVFALLLRFATPGAPEVERHIGYLTAACMMVVSIGIYMLRFVVKKL